MSMMIDEVNRAFAAAKDQADAAHRAKLASDASQRGLMAMERAEAAKAIEYGADPGKIQKVVAEKTAEARAEAEAAAMVAEEEMHRLRLLHYELDRIKTIVDLMRCRNGDA